MTMRRPVLVNGLSIEPEETVVCQFRKRGTQVQVMQTLRLPIRAGTFKTDPARAGLELLAALKTARIRGKRWVISLPLAWVFTAPFELPELSEADAHNFAQMEAERRFPLSPDELALTMSQRRGGEGPQQAMLVGVPLELLAHVDTALKAARVRPSSITVGMSALTAAQGEDGFVMICAGQGFVDIAAGQGGTVYALRNLAWEEEQSEAEPHRMAREIARQVRITLAQTAGQDGDRVQRAVLYGVQNWPPDALDTLFDALGELGLSAVEGVVKGAPNPAEAPPALLARAVGDLAGEPPPVELVTKRKARLQSAAARLSKRNVRWMIAAVASAILLVAGAFGYQEHTLSQLQDQWDAMAGQVDEAKTLQERVRFYRPWYDETIPSLAIPKYLATAFPEAGSVSLKSLHVKDRTAATCSGSASNFADLMQVKQSLDKSGDLDDLKLFSARGGTPVAFTLTFSWKGRASSGQ